MALLLNSIDLFPELISQLTDRVTIGKKIFNIKGL